MPPSMYTKLDPAKLADAQTVANKLAFLPEDALIYISGYVAGRWDAAKRREEQGRCDPTAASQDSA